MRMSSISYKQYQLLWQEFVRRKLYVSVKMKTVKLHSVFIEQIEREPNHKTPTNLIFEQVINM